MHGYDCPKSRICRYSRKENRSIKHQKTGKRRISDTLSFDVIYFMLETLNQHIFTDIHDIRNIFPGCLSHGCSSYLFLISSQSFSTFFRIFRISRLTARFSSFRNPRKQESMVRFSSLRMKSYAANALSVGYRRHIAGPIDPVPCGHSRPV